MVSRMTAKASCPTFPGTQIIGTDQISRIDLAAVDELINLDGSGRFQRNVLKLLLRHLDEGIGINLVALDDVLARDLFTSVGVDLGVFDAVARLAVELIERDFFGFGGGRIERNGTGDERKAQEAFLALLITPISKTRRDWRTTRIGPVYVKIGKSTLYPVDELDGIVLWMREALDGNHHIRYTQLRKFPMWPTSHSATRADTTSICSAGIALE